jgi:transcriptional regulator with XRE-family HTH domain
MGRSLRSGISLRQLRIDRGLTLRDVQQRSQRLAVKYREKRLIISPTRLVALEKTNAVPNLLRAWAMARIYGCGLRKLLKCFGLPAID